MRVLSAIIFADIEGYSALMQENEKQAIEYRNKFKNTLEENLDKYEGKIIQFYGDGALLTFTSGLKAVEYALKVQQEFQAEPTVPVRIGVHMGDVVIESDGIFGDSVNITSRIESIAPPGSVLISDKIQDEISNQSHIETKTLGLQNFKNVEKEIEVFAVTNKGVVNPDGINMEGKIENRSYKIAVLPLNNFSENEKLDSLADSISEEIISYLTMVPDFKITSRTSSFGYKGKKLSATAIGRELGVDMLVEGSIRKYLSQLRVTIQLVDVKHGFHVSSKNYDVQGILTLKAQDRLAQEIAKDIAQSLEIPNYEIIFQPGKKPVWGNILKYVLPALIIAGAIIFGIIYLTRGGEENGGAGNSPPDKDSIRNNVAHYLSALYESKHIYSGYNVNLSESFKVFNVPEKYDPFSSLYRDSNNTNKLEFKNIETDELKDLNYLCNFILLGSKDSIRAKLEAVIENVDGEIQLSKIEYTDIIPLKVVVPEKKKTQNEIDTTKTKKDTSLRKQKNDSLKSMTPKLKKELTNQIKKRLRRK